MPNHVHLVMVPSCADGLRSSLGETHRRYTRYINFKKSWRGHLWQERFHSFPMDENYLLATVRYVELNPVKAKLCTHPQDWRWSSASAHLNGSDDLLVAVKPMLDLVSNWQQYLTSHDSSDYDLISLHSRTGRPLGSYNFVKELEDI
jgi:putative transposase